MTGLRIAAVLARREFVAFARQPARVIAAIGTPLIIWLLAGSGFGKEFRPGALGEQSYALFLLPGIVTLVAVFTSIFSAISIIEERREGWLQSVLVAPAPRWSIALGKSLGGALVAFAQAILVLPIVWLVGARPDGAEVAAAVVAVALACLGTSALGVAFAWRCPTSAAFHAVMNMVFMPMWLLSGAFFPADGAVPWLGWLMRVNPLTWCTTAIREPLAGEGVAVAALVGAAAYALVALVWATVVVTGAERE